MIWMNRVAECNAQHRYAQTWLSESCQRLLAHFPAPASTKGTHKRREWPSAVWMRNRAIRHCPKTPIRRQTSPHKTHIWHRVCSTRCRSSLTTIKEHLGKIACSPVPGTTTQRCQSVQTPSRCGCVCSRGGTQQICNLAKYQKTDRLTTKMLEGVNRYIEPQLLLSTGSNAGDGKGDKMRLPGLRANCYSPAFASKGFCASLAEPFSLLYKRSCTRAPHLLQNRLYAFQLVQ
jgi:hypothetical protein